MRNTAQPIRIGPLTWLSWALALVLTFVVVWFKMDTTGLVLPAFLIMMVGGWSLIMLAGHVGLTRGGVLSMTGLAIGLLAMWAETVFAQAVFSIRYSAGDGLILAALFAVYEETLFLSFAVAGNAAGLPGLYTVIFSAIAFVPLHAYAQPDEMAFNVAAFLVRCTLSGMTAYSHESDPSVGSHLIWNVVMSL